MTTPPIWDDPVQDFFDSIDVVASAGVQPPEELTALRARLRDFLALTNTDCTPMRDRVTDAVLGGADADIPLLRCWALAEASYGGIAPLNQHVQNTLFERMKQLYAEVAAANYSRVCELYNQAAERFTKVAGLADPETPAAEMVRAPDRQRKSWSDSESYASELTKLIEPLQAASSLMGASIDDVHRLLPLLCDPSNGHRRRVWAAFMATGRTGRWGPLVREHCLLRAHPDPAAIEAYRAPAPLIPRTIPLGDGQYRKIQEDPEDADFTPPVIEAKRGKAVFA